MFELKIKLGNAAMQSRYDILESLYKVINQLQEGDDSGSVFDTNGNTVGKWEIKK